MNKAIEGALVFVSIMLILLGMVFLIASGIENTALGGGMVIVAVVILFFIYRIERTEAAKPKLVSQTFNVKMEGSGQLTEKEMKCKSCGAPLSEKDLMVVQGGIIVKCTYCGATYAIEEAPKW